MKKKTYCRASMRIINLQHQSHLLGGSPNVENAKTYGLGDNGLSYSGESNNIELAW